MTSWLWLIVSLAAAAGISTGVVMTAFLVLGSAKRLRDAAANGTVKLRPAMITTIYFWLLVGAPADAVYNWTIGSARFLKRPHKLWEMYSARIQNMMDEGDIKAHKYVRAVEDAKMMNVVDENHIKL